MLKTPISLLFSNCSRDAIATQADLHKPCSASVSSSTPPLPMAGYKLVVSGNLLVRQWSQRKAQTVDVRKISIECLSDSGQWQQQHLPRQLKMQMATFVTVSWKNGLPTITSPCTVSPIAEADLKASICVVGLLLSMKMEKCCKKGLTAGQKLCEAAGRILPLERAGNSLYPVSDSSFPCIARLRVPPPLIVAIDINIPQPLQFMMFNPAIRF